MTSMPILIVAQAGVAADSTPWWLAPATIGAVIAGVVAVAALIVNGRRARLDRQRKLFADVFAEVQAYREFPYIVRRRHPDRGVTQITDRLSDVQQALNLNVARLKIEAPRVARSYEYLVSQTRKIAGAAISAGWDQPPVVAETGNVHVTDVDLSSLDEPEAAYISSTRDHLSLAPAWMFVAERSVVTGIGTVVSWPVRTVRTGGSGARRWIVDTVRGWWPAGPEPDDC